MDDDILADGQEYGEEQRRLRLSVMVDEDGNALYDFSDADEGEPIQCECGIYWPAADMVDGLCPECRED